LSDRVAQDRCQFGFLRDVAARTARTRRHWPGHAAGDLVDHAVADGAVFVVEGISPVSSSTRPGTTLSMSTSSVSTAPKVAARAARATCVVARPSFSRSA
jgi:hypothetical protein